jgi:2-amino-4-hydroxy-6-hydroxymethyldihydropteridine diphosphokinase
MTTAFVGLGSNAGDRLAHLRRAVEGLKAIAGVEVEAVSPVYETEAHTLPGQGPQPDHLNAVVRLRTTLAPGALLDRLHALERAAGRTSGRRWGPRPLDLDLLLHGDLRLSTPDLVLPHPRLAERRFVLQPLADLAPDLVVPGMEATVAELRVRCVDTSRVEPTTHRL